ncbi:GTP-binding protein [candidate division MSBL1 archaeon SCGC-AAA259O05]|uniref:GTP-binding protein n=1 Tax=candidate division MSBL1 archaeon SCGC-AAA259O05 TaxID=1698271 RepID=A0A133V2G8_9EURY|nr:GTP-binding protein [candidate division MSBL1 archaeon SCGC-AAA259O05]
MTIIDEEIKKVEEEIRNTPYNKSTEQHIGLLKAKLAKLKQKKIEKAEKETGGKGYAIEKSGDATIILVGFPSVGKSTLLNSLTGAESEVANYDFTTLEVIPGALKYKGANFQILDVPGIISGASEGRGRGREVISVFRSADLLILMVDPFEIEQYKKIKKELYESGVRLNSEPPDVNIRRRDSGGLEISSPLNLTMSKDEIGAILKESGVINVEVVIREDVTAERLIDAIARNRRYIPGLVVINKIDLLDESSLERVKRYGEGEISEDVLYISAKSGKLETLKEEMFEKLNFIRIYLKPRGKEADREEPLILKEGAAIEDLCREIHRDFEEKFRYARVWGESVKHPGEKVGKNHELSDEDIVSVFT